MPSTRIQLSFCVLTSILAVASTSASAFEVRYQSHLANIGDTAPVDDGDVSGTIGEGRNMEALRIWNGVEVCSIQYEGHIDNDGWRGRVGQGDVAGSTGQNKNLQAVRVWLNGCPNKSVRYRAHVENIGWQSWVNQGEIAGTTGQGLAIQAIQITVRTTGDGEVEQLDNTRDGLAGDNGNGLFQVALLAAQVRAVNVQKSQTLSQLNSASGDLSNAKTELDQKQLSLETAKNNSSQAAADLLAAQQRQEAREVEARQEAETLAKAKQELADKLAKVAEVQVQLSALDRKTQEQVANLSVIKAKETDLKSTLEAAKLSIANTPPYIQRLVAQVGILRVSRLTCSAFELSQTTLRTAAHCVKGLSDAQIKTATYTESTGRSYSIRSVVSIDFGHDSADLQIEGSDDDFQSLIAAPNVILPLKILAWDQKSDAVSLSDECHLLSVNVLTGALLHDCVSAPGSSGGALIQDGAIVGFHLGVVGTEKLGAVVSAPRRRQLEAALLQSLIPEYNCSSDCRAEAYDRAPYPCPTFTNPGRMCHQDVFDPAKFSLCESARSSDCGARALSQEFARAKDNAHAEIDHLGHAVADVQSRVRDLDGQIGNIQFSIDDFRNGITRVQNAITSVRNQIVDVASQVASKAAEYAGITQSIAAAQRAEAAAIADRQRIVASTSDIVQQSKDVVASEAKAVEAINHKTATMASSGASLAEAEVKKLSLSRALAAGHAVVDLSKSLTSVVSKPVKDVGNYLDDEFAKSKNGIRSLKSSPNVVVSNLSEHLLKKITDTHNKYTDKMRVILKPLAGDSPRAAYVNDDPTFLLRNNVCAARTLARLDRYQADIKAMGIVELSKSVEEIQPDALARAEQLLTKSARSLAAMQIEIKANGCDSNGIDQVIGESLLDAFEWLAWVKEVRENLASNASK